MACLLHLIVYLLAVQCFKVEVSMSVYVIYVTLDSRVIEKRKMDQDVISIGRGNDNDIVINNLAVSRYHAMIFAKTGKLKIKDLGSANGTFINGEQIDESDLRMGYKILIGKHILKIQKEEGLVNEDVAFHSEGNTVMVDSNTQDKFIRMLRNDRSDNPPKIVVSGGNEVQLNKKILFMGKGINSDVKLDGFFIKKIHARLIKQDSGNFMLISDNAFFNPTKVNGRKINEVVLKDGDIIQIGNNSMVFSN